MTDTLWKFLDLRDGKVTSRHGSAHWVIGDWYASGIVGNSSPRLCHRGYHASRTPLDALSYIKGAVIAKVEVRGQSDVEAMKEAWSQMRIVDARLWGIRDSQELAIYAAELVLDIFESRWPGDMRPRDAIEAAKAYLGGDIDRPALLKARAAAASAYAADYVAAADYAAAAYAAASAYAAAAADYAAAAASAASAAASAAADYAARSELKGHINAWIIARFDTLEPVAQPVTAS